ncbi:MAG: carbohydrate-binding domain-containing protein [Clostridiales bacterium]|nr:carbohydrate-binding domain-containing protein [Clostridiales bacterium]
MTKKSLLALCLAAFLLLPPHSLPAQADTDPFFTASEEFSSRDMRSTYDESECIDIVFSEAGISCQSKNVSVSGSTVTILKKGTYRLTGEAQEGMVIVDADADHKVQLVLSGLSLHSQNNAPLYIRQADKVFITLDSESQNVLTNSGSFQSLDGNSIDAVIFSKEDLTLNGDGLLAISSPGGNGIVSKDDLAITGGSFQITASAHALEANNSIRILEGDFSLDAGKDALHAEHEDLDKGYCYIAGGSFVISAKGDGISASGKMQLDGGAFEITTGEGSKNAAAQQSFSWGGRGYTSSAQNSSSMKALKSSGDMLITGGAFQIDAEDDAVHANASIYASGGAFEIATGDDGFHADNALHISGGSILIFQSYEGLEGQSIEISGGAIRLTASDDGLNAAGGNDQSGYGGRWGGDIFAVDENCHITISGGSLFVDASGDGIDSNGHFTVSGGETYVSGPTNSGNGALDFGGNGVITGGVFLAAGSSGMAQSFDASSTQGVILASVNGSIALEPFSLKDQAGNELISWQSQKNFNLLIVSCPQIRLGETYTLSLGDATAQITMEQLVYTTGGGRGGPGGRPGR